MALEVVGRIARVRTIATGRSIRELQCLQRIYGPGRWRKRTGVARIRLGRDETVLAEVHWYEATGVGRKEMKIKRLLEPSE